MLEYAVRPYTSPNAQGKIIIPSTPSSTRERATLTWGAQSTLPPAVYTSVNTACCNENSNELSRQTETVRITGNDPDNWIDVARTNKMNIMNKKDTGECGADDPFGQFGDLDAQLKAAFGEDAAFLVSAPASSKENCTQTMTFHNTGS